MSGVGKYKVTGKLGKGGMGEVYRAIQTELGREVALKVLSEDASARRASERFMREMKLQARLEHPNLVRLYDAGDTGGRQFFAMELVEGETLSKRLSTEGRPHPSFVAAVGRQMASAFAYLHSKGMVHRDIKPSNVMVTAEDTVKIMDFGIAYEQGGERLTRTRAVVGTARYLSPEMARGEEPTGKSDIYQLGLILYEMVCGGPPITGPVAVTVARRAAGDRTKDPRKVWRPCPDRLAEVINLTLEPNPENRPDGTWLAEELEALEMRLQGWTEPTEPLPPFKSTQAPSRLMPSASGPQEAARSNMLSAIHSAAYPDVEDARPVPVGKVLALFTMVLLGGLLIRRFSRPVSYRVLNSKIRSGARGVVFTWTSNHAYPSYVEYGEKGSTSGWQVARGSDSTTEHQIVIEGLEPRKEYEYRIQFPNGQKSLPHSFRAPPRLEIQPIRSRIVGGKSLEWNLQLPVECRAKLTLTTAEGQTLTREKPNFQEQHRFSFDLDPLFQDPRSIDLDLEAADGPLERPIPKGSSLSVISVVTEAFSPEKVDWAAFADETEAIRTELGSEWSGKNLPQLQTQVQAVVRKRWGETGLLGNWSILSPKLAGYLAEKSNPWEGRRRLLDSLLHLALVDRIYDLYQLPEPFQVERSLSKIFRRLSAPPNPEDFPFRTQWVFPYSGNLISPVNYSENTRAKINSFSTAIFPKKGEVANRLEGEIVLDDRPLKRVLLGLEVRGFYSFLAMLVRFRDGYQGHPISPNLVFLNKNVSSDVVLSNEFDAIRWLGGRSLDEIFPVHTHWIEIPPESLRVGTNHLEVRLLSLQQESILPTVVRKLLVLAR